jgi:exopolysaccharide biosynthesis polyprenyl glycosylphosphotransferase
VLTRRLDLLGVGFALATLLALRGVGSHAPRINPRLGDDIALMLGAVAVPLAGVAFAAGGEAHAILVTGVVATGILLPLRGLTYAITRGARARGFVVEPTIIVGAGVMGREVARTLRDHPEYGLVPIGFIDRVLDEDLPLPLLGSPVQLERFVREFDVRRVIVAFGVTREPEMVDVIRACDSLPVEVHLVPRFFELGMSAEGPFKDDLWGIPVVRLRRSALRTAAWRTKRIFDLIVGSLLLLVTSPFFIAATIGVRLSGPGPIFFRQQRIGQNGRVFQLLKFRTMRVNEDSDVTWSVEDDRRVTFVGRILRRTSLDELPQLVNVLRGQMSLIGPRPERPYFVDQFAGEVSRYDDRHRVPVGITGWAQAHGLRGDTSIPERIRFDNYYIEHWSLWRDLIITIRTAWLIVTGRH